MPVFVSSTLENGQSLFSRRTRCSDQENEGACCVHLETNSYLYGYALEACRIFSTVGRIHQRRIVMGS